MSSERSHQGRAVFYHRDSEGRHDQSLTEYVGWGVAKARDLGLEFDGTPKQISAMVKSGESVVGDLYLDYGVRGHLMSRVALNQLEARIKNDLQVSHLLIVHRDRFARPNDPQDALQRERALRLMGVTIVYMNKVLGPLKRGQRLDLSEQLTGIIEFDQTGRFREELAKKMIHAQISLASQGFSAGGRAPYGFRRWLVDSTGRPVRQLVDRESVRQAGHHVCWLPGPDEELRLIRRILELLRTIPATRVAKILNAEGVPAPDKGRRRKDHGLVHEVSGLWHPPTITNIARNSLLVAVTAYGQRSMGDQSRHSSTGPRGLEDGDWRPDGKPKVVKNPESAIIRSEARFEPLVDGEKHEELLAILDQRGKSQRGKPRSKDPAKNPLGCRVFDLACSSVMYRTPYQGTFRYVCALYQQTNSDRCSHNHVDGLTATRFALAAVQQQVCSPTARKKLEDRLRMRAASDSTNPAEIQLLQVKQAQLAETEKNLKRATRNLALAEDESRYRLLSEIVSEFEREKEICQKEIASLQKKARVQASAKDDVASLLKVVDNLYKLADDSRNLGGLAELFEKLNLRMFLRFVPVKKNIRIENKLASGVLTMGAAPLPIEPYSGPTSRSALTLQQSNSAGADSARDTEPNCSGLEDKSLGNGNRGDRI